jgi:hypothetical protein
VRLVIFVTFLFVSAPRPSRSQSACIESLVLNATVCFWDASNHSSITSPAIVGVTVLPLLHPNRAMLFASFNGGSLVPLSAGAAAVPVPPVDALQSCHSECNGHSTASGSLRCCSAVIDLWLVSNKSRSNIGCSLYFTIPAPAPPAALHPIIFKFHGEINAGLQVSPHHVDRPISIRCFHYDAPNLQFTANTRCISSLHVHSLFRLLLPRHLHRCWCQSLFQRNFCAR